MDDPIHAIDKTGQPDTDRGGARMHGAQRGDDMHDRIDKRLRRVVQLRVDRRAVE